MESGYQEARQGAAFDIREDRGRVLLDGADAAILLHALLTNDITGLAEGQGCYAALLTPQGRMISDMEVLRTSTAGGVPRVLLAVPAPLAADLAERFDRSIFTEDVAVSDASMMLAQVGVIGPAAAGAVDAALAALGFGAVASRLVRPYDNATPGADVIVWRGEPLDDLDVFDLVVPRAQCDAVREALAAHAAPLSAGARTVLRVEAGRPAFLVDMTADTIPLEANLLERGISTSKGCYVGQEVIIRVLHRGGGRVAKRLMPLTIEGRADDVPPAGTTLSAGDKEIGRVTSAVWSPQLSSIVALGYVHRDHAHEGAELRLPGGRAAMIRNS
jgi:folate-binding protein YgfZ